ncbi:response regulator [Effusibacillus lacus]|uniref:Transcriptional regulatory protein n=1 Tax=Effusibacillus lacus TaxID=1348429 RepID=A0A292YM09_9BACL|nr:response regulator [Effusibacillus lacus]TCS71408.1 two-component system response regulator DctR [Effusibacillus lacus]GAX89939.1 two-component system response regulator [Effusibacillus lacus]
MEPVRLVIVEDDPMVMEVNSEFVSRISGYKIIGKAFNGSEAWKVINQTKPDLVLLDYFLPDMDGLSLLKDIRNSDLPVDVIFVTANRDPGHIQQILRFGAVDYIFKPFRFERIRTALDQYRFMRKKFREQQIEQRDMDVITGIRVHDSTQTGGNDLPKGLNDRTLQQILSFLAEQTEPMSAEDVAAGTGLARVTARRYLEYLQKKGHIQLEVQYGSIGRPVNRYKK